MTAKKSRKIEMTVRNERLGIKYKCLVIILCRNKKQAAVIARERRNSFQNWPLNYGDRFTFKIKKQRDKWMHKKQ